MTTKPIRLRCELCGRDKVATTIVFKQNVSLIFRRYEKEFCNVVCLPCMTSKFFEFQLITVVGTWWGVMGCFLGPMIILSNIFEYLSGGSIILCECLGPRSKLEFSAQRPPPSNLLGELGELLERYPTALLDATRLPASKQKMKAAIKEAWQHRPELGGPLAMAYVHLSNFQDGIGDAVLECDLSAPFAGPTNLEAAKCQTSEVFGPGGENFRRWIMWSKVSQAEAEILRREWNEFTAAKRA